MKDALRRVLRLLILAIVIYGVICLLLAFLQRSLIYFPTTGRSEGVPYMELQRPDASIRISVLRRDADRAVIYFGGNAEDVSYSIAELAEAFPDTAIYAMHYRGYGGSTGRPNEQDLIGDALALLEYVQDFHHEIFLAGRSLGSGVAIQVASRRNVAGLLLITPFDSLLNVAKHYYPWLPINALLLDRYESWRVASQITSPTLIIAADHDSIIPRSSTENLERSFAKGTCQAIYLKNTDHNSIPLPIEAINGFIQNSSLRSSR
jgi:pimeloyl-ACP methyl ester carboxylesterase